MKRRMSQRVMGVLLLAFVLWPTYSFGQAEPFPVKPINVYVGYPPGGNTAITGQIVADGMRKYLNQPVIVNFKVGAVQAIAAEFVKNSKPDGYTLVYLAHGNLIAKIAKDKREGVPVKVQIEDLESLGAGPYSPWTIAVNGDSPWKTIEDLIAAARKSPGGLNYGTDGVGKLQPSVAGIILPQGRHGFEPHPFPGRRPGGDGFARWARSIDHF